MSRPSDHRRGPSGHWSGDWTCACGQSYRVLAMAGEVQMWPRNSSSGYRKEPIGDYCFCGTHIARGTVLCALFGGAARTAAREQRRPTPTTGKMSPLTAIKTFGPVDERSLRQLERCMEAGDAEFAVLCADHHPGYSQPIGGGIAYEGYVSPSGVGYDIGCGNKAVRTDLGHTDLEELGGVEPIMKEITRRISFGMGVRAQERTDHAVLENVRRAEFTPQRKLAGLAESQLGTVGSGNHYVNLMADEDDRVWVGVHFGSRGFGHKTASGFLALAQGLPFEGHAREGAMDSPPVLFEVDSELGRSYISAMELAGEYAYAGRDVVVDKVLGILGATAEHEVHNHHNFAWREEHQGRTYWVIRKGCTPARPGQEGFVGGSMGDESVILEGVESDTSAEALYSTVHGAGRVMSRSQAAGRVRRHKRWACRNRDCDRVFDRPRACPDHPGAGLQKIWVTQQVKPGSVDWPAVQERLRSQGIVLVGGAADEAPEVYKRLPDVLAAHAGSIRVKYRLRPLGVAMAGRDVYDPYKD